MNVEKGLSTQLQGKKRKSHRRSSILKATKSPSREALADLNPNAKPEDGDVTQDAKKQRRSRRVSFAETMTVKEFVKEVRSVPAKVEVLENLNGPNDTEDGSSLYKKPDSSTSSLNTLLTAPFVHSGQNTNGPTYQCPMPNMSDDSIQSNETNQSAHSFHHNSHLQTSHHASSGNADMSAMNASMDFTKCVGGQIFVPPRQFNQKDMSSGAYEMFNKKPVEFQNTSVNKFVGSKPFDADKTHVFEDDDSGNMDLTACLDRTINPANSSTSLCDGEKIDTLGFLKRLSGGGKPKLIVKPQLRPENASLLMLFGNNQKDNLPNSDSGDFELNLAPDFGGKKIDASSFLQKFQTNTSLSKSQSVTNRTILFSEEGDGNTMELTACHDNLDAQLPTYVASKTILTGELNLAPDFGGKKIDASSFLQKFQTNTSLSKSQPVTNRTILFSEQGDGDTMELTACHDNLGAQLRTGMANKTILTGDGECEGIMDMTECIGGLLNRTASTTSQDGGIDTQKLLSDLSAACKNSDNVLSQDGKENGLPDDNGMDFTKCQTGFISVGQAEGSMNTKNLLKGLSGIGQSQFEDRSLDTHKILAADEHGMGMTKRFDSDDMDFTTCQEVPISLDDANPSMNTKHLLSTKSFSGGFSKSQFIDRSMDTQKLLAGNTLCWRSVENDLSESSSQKQKGNETSVLMQGYVDKSRCLDDTSKLLKTFSDTDVEHKQRANETSMLLDGFSGNKSRCLDDTSKLLKTTSDTPNTGNITTSQAVETHVKPTNVSSQNSNQDKATVELDEDGGNVVKKKTPLSDDGIEFTICGGMMGDNDVFNDSFIPTRAESTRRIDVDVNKMEFTKCMGDVEEVTGKSTEDLPDQNTNGGNPNMLGLETKALSKTQVFENNSADMQLTACVDAIVAPQLGECLVNRTVFFDSPDMEFTKCVDAPVELLNDTGNSIVTFKDPSMSLVGKPNVDINHQDTEYKTQQFDATSANMEFTACIGKVDIGSANRHLQISNTVASTHANATHHFTSESTTAGMELTCFDLKGKIEVPKVSTKEISGLGSEMTTAGMELTTCVGHISLVDVDGQDGKVALDKSSHNQLESSEMVTKGMEFTTCVGHINVEKGENRDEAMQNTAEKIPIELTTAVMEFTACVGNISTEGGEIIQDSTKECVKLPDVEIENIDLVSDEEVPVGSDSKSDMNDMPLMDSIVDIGVFDTSVVGRNKSGSVKDSVHSSSVLSGYPHKLEEPSEVEGNISQGTAQFASPVEEDVDRRTLYTNNHDKSQEMDLLEDIQPPTLEISFNIDPPQQDNAKCDTVEKPHTKPSCDSTMLATSQNKSVLSQMSMMEKSLMTAPQDGPWSCSDFLEYIRISFSTTNASRRSTIAPVSMDPPDGISDYLELVCLIQPELHQHEWACEYFRSKIDGLKESIAAAEQSISEDNPEIFNKVRGYKGAQLEEFENDAKSLLAVCRKMSKTMYKDWHTKLLKTILEAYKEEEDCLDKCVEELDSVNESVCQQLTQANEVELDLDRMINELEGLPMPCDDDAQPLSCTAEELEAKQKQLENLEAEKKQVQREHDGTVLERDNVEAEMKHREQELVKSVEGGLQESYQTLQRYQGYAPWKLTEYDESHAQFSFLCDSLTVEVLFSGDGRSGDQKSTEKIAISIKSHLSVTAAPWARLAHAIILRSLDQTSLDVVYTTVHHLPQFLTRLSKQTTAAFSLGEELELLDLYHSIKIEGTTVMVEISNLDAFCKLQLTFPLQPGSYPTEKVHSSCTILIGELSESSVMDVLSAVVPGPLYLQRMVSAVNECIEQHKNNIMES